MTRFAAQTAIGEPIDRFSACTSADCRVMLRISPAGLQALRRLL
jgi:hypothetical protein